MDAILASFSNLLTRQRRHADGGAGVPGRRYARLLADGLRARAQFGQAAHRPHHGRERASGSCRALAAPFQREGGDPAHRIHHQALFGSQRRQHEGAAPAAGAGRHLRSARRRLLLHGAHRAGGRLRRRGVPAAADGGAAGLVVLLADGDRRRHRRLCRPQHVYRPPHCRPQARAPLGLSRFHGLAGGLRRFRAVDGGERWSASAASWATATLRSPPTST